MKKIFALLSGLMIFSMILSACAPQTVVQTVVVTEVVTQEVVVEGTPQVKEVVKTVVVEATPEPKKPQLIIFNWWTAPGEREAADAMYEAFKAKYPDVEIVENPTPGGGGVNQRVVLQARMTAGLPPDTFQTLGGAELKAYVDAGQLEPLDDLWAQLDYANKIPGPLAKAVTVDGHPYVVPLNMHIQNILYYNKALFDELQLTPPTNYDELVATCEAIKAAKPDLACIGLGSKEKWGDAFVFDAVFMEEAGPADYVKFYKGELDPATFEPFKRSLEKFQALAPYINTDHAGLTWDQATALLPGGTAAMTLMGTWAIGALEKGGGWKAGVDFGAVTFPQKPERILLFHPDTYGLAKGAPNPETTLKWLEVVASPELQVPTDVIQGGLFARTDIDPTEFPDPIRQELMQYVRDNPDKLILDQHGSIAPSSFTSEYWNAIASFLVQPNVDATIQQVASLFQQFNVKDASAWYQWP
ncbi:MAG: extracellular solute-binding protein [Anaerolineales bacterium]|jgi:glucose/mannose transport system substrate-binding protein|nr:extracellular solute-binding protein [Anaerolineales bacterium]